MVKEFTDLQGIVGGLYAKAQGEPEPVSAAPSTNITSRSAWRIPSLRRTKGRSWRWPISWILCAAVSSRPDPERIEGSFRSAPRGSGRGQILAEAKSTSSLDDLVSGDLRAFLLGAHQILFPRSSRITNTTKSMPCWPPGGSTLADVEARLSALLPRSSHARFRASGRELQAHPEYPQAGGFSSRRRSIGRCLKPGRSAILCRHFVRVRMAQRKRISIEALERLRRCGPRSTCFFDKVLVNATDPEVRANRLTLLHHLLTEFSTIADFSEIVTSRRSKNEKLRLQLRRRHRRWRRQDERRPGRQRRGPGRDEPGRASPCLRDSPSPPKSATSISRTGNKVPKEINDQVSGRAREARKAALARIWATPRIRCCSASVPARSSPCPA